MQARTDPVRASRLRTLYRLRSGLPPAEHLDQLTSNASDLLKSASRLLSDGSDQIRWMQVTGDYGEGKSHFLSLMRDLAHREGYATCYLSCDGASAALNHPQRFMTCLLATLELPNSGVHGYEDLLREALLEKEGAEILKRAVGSHIAEMAPVAQPAWYYLDQVIRLLSEGAQPDERRVYEGAVVQHLTGQSIRHKFADPRTRRGAYAVLQIASDLLVARGLRGLLLLIDEVESVYTKLPNVLSRCGAYRVLSALCQSTELRSCRVVLALTTDAARYLLSDARSMPEQVGNKLTCEPIVQWARQLNSGSRLLVLCRPLDKTGAEFLVKQVREFYACTYPHTRGRLRDADWQRFVTETLRRGLPVRLLVRQTVDFLDGERWRST